MNLDCPVSLKLYIAYVIQKNILHQMVAQILSLMLLVNDKLHNVIIP